MSKICLNCGKETKDTAKFCGRCGKPFETAFLNSNADHSSPISLSYAQNQRAYESSVSAINNIGTTPTSTSSDNSVTATTKRDIKINKKLITICSICAVVLIVLVVAIALISKDSASDETVAQAALLVAQQEYGYKLELKDCKIIDSFKCKTENPLSGNKIKNMIYLVIVEADAKDENGNVAETVKYAVSLIDPKEKNGNVIYDQATSTASECTGMDNSEIEKQLLSNVAAFR
ncbi:MAG: zinc ribbon domain-containing protein [Eubacterium sp.]